MENQKELIESLAKKTESYLKTNIELFKLKSIDKLADTLSDVASNIIMLITVSMLIIMVNIGVAIWLGELLGKIYYGFFVVAGFYLLAAFLINIFKNGLIKKPVNDAIIIQMIKGKNYE